MEERRSKFNGKLRVVKTWGMGTYIQADGLTQSGGIVESIWKQTLKRVKSEKGKAKSVLILGLGGGTVAKLILKNWPDAKITGVDIDPVIVELGQKYLGLNVEDIDIRIGDAKEFISGKFDLVIVDLYNGDEFPKKFEEEKFLKILVKNKLVVFNRLTFKNKKEETLLFGDKLKKIFKKVEYFYPTSNLIYLCSGRLASVFN